MLLILDNSTEHEIACQLLVNNKIVHSKFEIVENNDFLRTVEKFLSEQNAALSDLTGLGLVMGTGRFTATRLLVTLINTLAFSLHIPAISLPANFDTDMALAGIAGASAGQYILPVYSSEPHIGASL